jgi:nicotinamide-nucleotide amidase
MDNALEQLTLQLKKRRLTISVAESCTGGLVAQQLTSLSGSSAYFDSGFIVYNGAAKQRLLGVPANVIENSGEVSRKTVIAMAEGAIKHSAAHLALAITGIAGPTGGTTEKPVGMVWIGWAGKNYETESKVFHFKGDRQSIRQQAADAAMHGMVHYLVKNA